jgi:bleomycin hydrolase
MLLEENPMADSQQNVVGALTLEKAAAISKSYEADLKNNVVRHALSRNPISEVVFEPSSVMNVAPQFNVEVKTLPVANQRASGRCWIFAGLNVLRELIAKKCNIKKFELSQNYISLFDKIEKSNFALESIIKLSKNAHDDRVLQFILTDPVSDGGQWDMFVNLVKKYGLVPQDAFPETFQSNNTRETDQLVNAAIRNFAYEAHRLALKDDMPGIRALKDQTMEKIYDLFLNAFGVPPKTFGFAYTDSKDKFHEEEGLTPKSFFDKYVGEKLLDEYQSLINSPTADKPYGKNFTIDFLGNVVEGKSINHLNVTMERMKTLIVKQLKDGFPVWFGSDVGFYRDRASFAWDANAFDYLSNFGFDIKFDKGGMLDYRHSAMNHAMVIVGVEIVNGLPTKWKIENSWGDDNGLKGYYVMSSAFFDTFVYQAVVLKRYLNQDEVKAAGKDPIHLPPWDPMGTLAD